MTRGKVFLLLLVALGVALYLPDSRARILGVVSPVMNPAYRWMSSQEMNQIVEDLRRHEQTRGSLPVRFGEFDPWMDRRYPQDRSRIDSWGNRYRFQLVGEMIRVTSAGPDGEWGTEDDLMREGVRQPRGR